MYKVIEAYVLQKAIWTKDYISLSLLNDEFKLGWIWKSIFFISRNTKSKFISQKFRYISYPYNRSTFFGFSDLNWRMTWI
jgi:hypothetical protein